MPPMVAMLRKVLGASKGMSGLQQIGCIGMFGDILHAAHRAQAESVAGKVDILQTERLQIDDFVDIVAQMRVGVRSTRRPRHN